MSGLKQRIKLFILKIKWKKLKVWFGKHCQISFDSTFEGANKIGENSFFAGQIGYASYIGENCHVTAKIGRFTCIAPRVITVRGSHPTKDWVSLHPAFYSTMNQSGVSFVDENKFEEIRDIIKIGNDVWIGDSAVLLDGISIGDGAVVAAGAVVTKDVEPYTIVGGVPAKVIRKRFSNEQIDFLLKSEWWAKPISLLQEQAALFEDINSFMEEFNSN